MEQPEEIQEVVAEAPEEEEAPPEEGSFSSPRDGTSAATATEEGSAKGSDGARDACGACGRRVILEQHAADETRDGQRG